MFSFYVKHLSIFDQNVKPNFRVPLIITDSLVTRAWAACGLDLQSKSLFASSGWHILKDLRRIAVFADANPFLNVTRHKLLGLETQFSDQT